MENTIMLTVLPSLAAALLLVYGAALLWRAIGRRRDQPEARLREERAEMAARLEGLRPAKRWPHRLDSPEAKRQRGNGATERRPPSPRATGTSGDGQSGRRTS